MFLKNLLECTLSASAMALLLLLVIPLLSRRYSPRGIYWAWLTLLPGFLVPWRPHAVAPVVTVTVPQAGSIALSMPAQTAPVPAGHALYDISREAASRTVQNAPGLTWVQVLFLVWLAGVVLTLAIHLYKHFRFSQVVRRWGKPIGQEEYIKAFQQVKAAMGIKQKVSLMLCPPVDSPMLTGLFRPAILLPDMDLSRDELQMVLTHELTHLRRRDLWAKAAMLLAIAMHWFNPVIYLMNRSFCFHMEASCDASVTINADLETRRFYSETIIAVIRRQSRLRTAVSTSFYAGKNGMKRRILSIMEDKGKKLGTAMVCMTLTLAVGVSMAFAVSYLPELPAQGAFEAGQTAYVYCPDGKPGAPVLSVPSTGDIDIPIGIYYSGTQATILELRASSSLPEWNSKDGQNNWARVSIGGDGSTEGISGFIPLYYLSATQHSTLPTAQVAADSPTSHTNLYRLNDDTSLVLDVILSGTEVTLLGLVNKWYHVRYGEKLGFVRRGDIALDGRTQSALDASLPDRFDDISRERMDSLNTFHDLVSKKQAELGTLLEYWPLEDKAWYGQLEETYGGVHDYYYMMPQAGDLQKEDAVRIAWEKFITLTESTGEQQEEYETYLGFYTIPDEDPGAKMWSVIFKRPEYNIQFEAILSSPTGQVLQTSDVTLYRLQTEQEKRMAEQRNAMAQWEAEKGHFPYWLLQDKAEFSALYMDGSYGLPDARAIQQEKATELAKAEIFDKYDVPQSELDSWKIGLIYSMQNPDIPIWRVSFHDSQDNFLAEVAIDAYTGAVLDSSDPYGPSNG